MRYPRVGLLLALCCAAAVASPAVAKPPSRAPLDDRCTEVAGYAEFREKLKDAVERRDAAAFDALFTPAGAMRVHSFSRFRGAGDERWGSAEVGRVWKELEAILPLGCSVDGERLYLPAMAALIDHSEIEQSVVALTDLMVGSRPGRGRGTRRLVRAGELLSVVNYGQPDDWIEVLLRGRRAYVREKDVRSIHDFVLTLTRQDGSWRIREFTDGV